MKEVKNNDEIADSRRDYLLKIDIIRKEKNENTNYNNI